MPLRHLLHQCLPEKPQGTRALSVHPILTPCNRLQALTLQLNSPHDNGDCTLSLQPSPIPLGKIVWGEAVWFPGKPKLVPNERQVILSSLFVITLEFIHVPWGPHPSEGALSSG
jgi:hypothetical protein